MKDTTIIKSERDRFDWHKFFEKAAIRLAYRAIEMSILLAVGAAFGLKLVRY